MGGFADSPWEAIPFQRREWGVGWGRRLEGAGGGMRGGSVVGNVERIKNFLIKKNDLSTD